MAVREELHRLVDTLPEAALDNARQMLERMQVWPPPSPPGWEQMLAARRRHMERADAALRPGTSGGRGAIGGLSLKGDGHQSSTHWEDQTAVTQTWRYHKGHELNIVEKLRLDQDGKALVYIHEITGPKDVSHRHEMTFDLA